MTKHRLTPEMQARLEQLIRQMTLTEKIQILMDSSPENPRLGIPHCYHGNEALHGVVRPGRFTVFPQAIAFGATFDPALIHTIAGAISDESRAAHHHGRGVTIPVKDFDAFYNGLLTFWSPDLNLCRDPRWGRTPETYGEDPYLAGTLGVAFVTGLQGDDPVYLKAVSTPKHYTANNEEHNRFSCSAVMREKSLREYHLMPFRMAVEEGGCEAVMAAYNGVNGFPCHASKHLLQDILRDEWRFDGYVVSDCGAIEFLYSEHRFVDTKEDAASTALNAGVDLECGVGFFKDFLLKQAAAGKTTEERITEACRSILRARFKLGQFDPDDKVPFSKIPLSVVGCEKHQQLAYQAAAESIVLLKNNGVLPLKTGETVAVVGNNAHLCRFGDYSGSPVHPPVSPLDGIRKIAGDRCTFVRWRTKGNTDLYTAVTEDCLRTPDGKPGLLGTYYQTAGFTGDSAARIDRSVDFEWVQQMPDPLAAAPKYAIRWEGFLCPPRTGKYSLRLIWNGCSPCRPAKLYLDGQEVPESAEFDFSAGERHTVRIEYVRLFEKPMVRFQWIVPASEDTDFYEECEAAKKADKVVAVIGLGVENEREGKDRDEIELPPEQNRLIERLCAVNPNTVVVLVNGAPIAVPEIHKQAAAVVEAWYPGEQGGNALADLLYGRTVPSGRLCASFPMRTADLPPFDDYEQEHGRTYMYCKIPPLYPFGFGLSYTRFSYSALTVDGDDITFTIRNTGSCAGDEVWQLYLDSAALAHQPKLRLVRFGRVRLAAGEEVQIAVSLDARCFALYDWNGKEFAAHGGFTLYAGGCLPDDRSKALGATSDWVSASFSR